MMVFNSLMCHFGIVFDIKFNGVMCFRLSGGRLVYEYPRQRNTYAFYLYLNNCFMTSRCYNDVTTE